MARLLLTAPNNKMYYLQVTGWMNITGIFQRAGPEYILGEVAQNNVMAFTTVRKCIPGDCF
jgi:hypothetical protein